MKKSELQQIIKEEIQKVLNEEDSMSKIWRDADIVRKTRILNNKHVADAREMAIKYQSKEWEVVKKELKLKD